MNQQNEQLSMSRVFVFWLPLAATWFMMSVEGPFLAAVIARMAEPKFNLAAYGVAFSVALIVEAPVIMIMGAATTLVRNRQAFLKLRRFIYLLNTGVTALMVVVLLPSVFSFLAGGLLHLPPEVQRLTYTACLLLLPWPGAIGYRRFYQGILIRNDRTRYVAYGTVVRLVAMGGTAFVLRFLSLLDGAAVGAAALSAGVVAEACASRLMVRGVLPAVLAEEGKPEEWLTYREIIVFYLPLALTTILALGIRPMVTFFIGQSRMAIESLAVLPVVQSLVFLFVCVGLSYQEVVIVLAGDRLEQYPVLRRFAVLLGGVTLGCLALISFTPLSRIWFQEISGLTPALTAFALLPVRILTPAPALWVWYCFQRAVLMRARTTAPITRATVVEVVVLLPALFILIRYLDAVGATAAAIALLLGRIAAPGYLYAPFRRALRRFR